MENKKKRILFKSGSTTLGGVEKVQIEYINCLVEAGYEVKLVIENDQGENNILEKYLRVKPFYLKPYEQIDRWEGRKKESSKNIFAKFRYKYESYRLKQFKNTRWNKIYQEFSPDLVIDFDAGLGKKIASLSRSKNIVWIHSSIVEWKKKPAKIQRFLSRLGKYDKIICICQEMLEDLIQLQPNLEKKAIFLYNPLNVNEIVRKSRMEVSEEDKRQIQEKYSLMVSRFDVLPKDFETLFQAFELAKEKGYDGKLYLIGSGPDEEKVREMLGRMKYSKEIVFLGARENPYPWMAKADKVVLSSRYEGFGLVLLEALVLGKRVISSACKTGPKEILSKGRGKLFPVGDAKRFSELLLESVPERRESYSLEEFQRESILKQFLEVVEDLC